MARTIIKNRVLIGHKSKTATGKAVRYYTRRALEDCIPLAEGRHVFLNHGEPGKRRDIRELAGRAVNVHYEARGLCGDLEVDDELEDIKKVVRFIAGEIPVSGISPDMDCILGHYDGETYVTKINEIRSFDLVAQPATANIMESEPAVDTVLEEKILNIPTLEQYNALEANHKALEARLMALEAVRMAPPQSSPPVAPPPVAYSAPSAASVEALVKNCRG